MKHAAHWKKHLPKLLGVTFVIAVGLGVSVLINNFMESKPNAPKKKVQQITLVQPPPPPPPPPKIEKPPEQKIEQEVDIPEPEMVEDMPEAMDEPMAGDQLGLDADGAAGSDGFGLIGRKGGRGLLSGAGDPFVIYASQLQRLIEDAFTDTDELRSISYSIVVKIWVSPNGEIERAELATSTGKKNIDKMMVKTIKDIDIATLDLPENMSFPIKYRLTSRL
jgi:protein TonB